MAFPDACFVMLIELPLGSTRALLAAHTIRACPPQRFSDVLSLLPDAEQVRLRLGTAFIEHRHDLWPQGEPAATDEWIRAHAFDILAVLEQMIGRDGNGVRRLPHRLHGVLWLLDDLDCGPLGG